MSGCRTVCSVNGIKKHALLRHDLVKVPRKDEWRRVSGAERDTLHAKYSAWAGTSGTAKRTPPGSSNPVGAQQVPGTLVVTSPEAAASTMSSRTAVTDCVIGSAAIDVVSELSFGMHTPTLGKSPHETMTRASTPLLFREVADVGDQYEPDSSAEDVDTGQVMTTRSVVPDTEGTQISKGPTYEDISVDAPATADNNQNTAADLTASVQAVAGMTFVPVPMFSYEALEFLSPECTVDKLMENPNFDFTARAQDLVNRGVLDHQTAAGAVEDAKKCKRHLQRFASNLVIRHSRRSAGLGSDAETATKELLNTLCTHADPHF